MKEKLSLLRNVAMLSISSYVELALGLILGVVIARSLGSNAFGHYAFAVWMCGTLIALCNNALTMSSIKFIAEARGAGREDLAASITARLHRWQLMSSTLVLAVFVAIAVIRSPGEWKDFIGIMLPLIILGSWSRAGYMMMAAIGKGNERFEVESLSLVMSALVNLTLVCLLALIDSSLVGFFAIYAVCGLVQNLTARVLLRRFGIRPQHGVLSVDLEARIKRHLLQSGALVVVGLLGERTIEVLLLSSFSTADAVGFFAIAGALTKGATYLFAGALSSVLLPAMARAFGVGGTSSVVRILPEAIRFYWFIGVAIAGLGAAVAPGAVRLLYGAQYEQAIPAVMVNLMIAGFVLISAAFNAFQTSSDHQADRIRVAALTLAVNLVVGIALVPTFGLAGALGSLAITRFAAVYFSWRFAVKGRAIKMPVTSMSRVLISAVYAGVAAQLFEIVVPGRYSFIVAGVIFFVVYVAESVVLGAWKQSDFDLIAEVLSQFGGRGRSAASWIQTTASRYAAGNGPEQPGRRELVGRVAQSLGIPRIAGTIRSQLRSDFRVLAYHRILPELDDATFRFDTELVSARKEEFEWQMAYVARRFRLVSCQDVADAIAKDRPLPKRAVMVTFDDGFHDNYSVAFPVLRRLGVPATFFLSTGYIGTNRMFWFDWVVHALMCTPLTEVALVSLNTTLDLRAGDAARRAAARKLLLLLKRTSESTRQKTIVELQQIVRIENSAAEGAQNAPMTWGQVREMSAAGMEFGSHTVSHPILSTIGDPIRLRDELQSSKTIIEQETGRTVLSLAYPVGGPDALNAEVVQATADAGYRFAFTYQPGVNRLSMEKRFHLKRLQVERYTTRDMFSAAIELPEIFA